MRNRKIATFVGTGPRLERRVVHVRYLPEFEEFVCEVSDNGKRKPNADYFTNDKDDAMGTAGAMASAGEQR